MDPARFEMRDPVVEIFGARAQMAAGLAQNVRRLLECALAGVGLSVSVRYEGEGTQRAIIGLNDDPARHVGRRLQVVAQPLIVRGLCFDCNPCTAFAFGDALPGPSLVLLPPP